MYKDEATFIKTEISRLTKMDYDDVGIDKVRLAHLIRLDTASWRKTFQAQNFELNDKPHIESAPMRRQRTSEMG